MIFEDRDSPNKTSRKGVSISMVIIHGDASPSESATLSWLLNPKSKASYHYLVGRDGVIYRLVPEDMKAWHAGVSHWRNHTYGNSVNPGSIGISFSNDGTGEEMFTDEQYLRGAELLADVTKRYKIPVHLVRGHYEVSPGRKTDPWDHFDWRRLFALHGMFATGRITS